MVAIMAFQYCQNMTCVTEVFVNKWKRLNFLLVGWQRSIITSQRVITSLSLLSSSNSISHVLIWINLPDNHVFWHVHSLSTFCCLLVLRTISISRTICILICRGNLWSALGLLVYRARMRGFAIGTSSSSTSTWRALTCWFFEEAITNCFPTESNRDIFQLIWNSIFQ